MDKKIFESFEEYLDGVGDKTNPEELDQKQLAVGIAVEKEHSSNEEVATKIAIDHLTEVPDYYTKLILGGLVDEEPAIEKFKELYPELANKIKEDE